MKKFPNKFGTTLYFGDSFYEDITDFFNINKIQSKNILLFTGEKFFKNSKYYSLFCDLQEKNNNKIIKEFNIKQNPKEREVLGFYNKFKNNKNLVIISIGGGSVIDCAKLFSHYMGNKIEHYSIPTTFGSGAVFSSFIIFDNFEFKIGIMNGNVIPKSIYVNEEIINGLSKELKLVGIIDIFTHSLESYLSKISNKTTRKYSKLSFKHINKYFNSKFKSLKDVLLAEIYSINAEKTSLILFPHGAGHYLTYKKGVKHPLATFFYLETFMDYLKENKVELPDETQGIMDRIKKEFIRIFFENDSASSLKMNKKYLNFIFKNSPIKLTDNNYLNLIRKSNQKWKIKDY